MRLAQPSTPGKSGARSPSAPSVRLDAPAELAELARAFVAAERDWQAGFRRVLADQAARPWLYRTLRDDKAAERRFGVRAASRASGRALPRLRSLMLAAGAAVLRVDGALVVALDWIDCDGRIWPDEDTELRVIEQANVVEVAPSPDPE